MTDKESIPSTVGTTAPAHNTGIIKLQYPAPGEQIQCSRTKNVYTIADVIGEGNFGIVYACHDIWGNELAVKVLKPLRRTYQAVQMAFFKEVEQLLRLRHPFITYVHDAFEFRNAFYIVTERCSSTLADMMTLPDFHGRIWLRSIAHCILQAVHFVHSQGCLHQDIHMGNVFSTFVKDEFLPDNHQALQFKLGDLGISRLIEEVSEKSTMADWMRPPEVLASSQFGKPDHRVDIYHLGLLFLQIIIGRDVHFSPEQILTGIPAKMAYGSDMPAGKVVARALACKVEERISSALLFWQELDKVLPKQEISEGVS